MKHRCLSMLLALLAMFGLLLPASAEEALEGDIIFATMSTGDIGQAQAEIIEAFMAENPGVNVEIQTNTTDYENLMKPKWPQTSCPTYS